MENPVHTVCDLFRQLGLPAEERSVERFIATHRPVAPALPLAEAPFWSDAQKQFLRENLRNDADWSQVIDMLDARLRH